MPASSKRRRLTTATALTGLVAAPLAVVGLTSAPASAADPVDVQILATNDFHGRIQDNRLEAGAAVMAGAVDQLRADHPNTVFAAAGDLIGASTFESFIQDDNPTIDALNAAGLDVSAVGNHEFDKGYDDLAYRVNDRANWHYLGANVGEPEGADLIEESWLQDFGTVQVGFVGAVTEHLDELVSPAGIEGVTIEDIALATNREAAILKAQGADAVILLVHEGAPSTDCATMADDPSSDFGSIITGVDESVDAIVSGHTHLAYACEIDGRPVVSAGQYGMNLNKLVLTVEDGVGVTGVKANEILPLVTEGEDEQGESTYTPNYPADAEVESIVAEAVAQAEVLGARTLGQIDHAFNRAIKSDGSENRGGESTLGNLVAEVHQWATRKNSTGDAQIAFMNPGGLRADMVGDAAAGYPADVTYKGAATVQPFANTLVNMDLTGRQIRKVLEEQWQPDGSSRPFLRLGVSRGFEYAYDPKTGQVTQMWLHGERVKAGQSYSVTVNSFLASGGDNFGTFAKGTSRQDTGKTDLEAMVDYMARHGADNPATSTWDQHAVGLKWRTDRVVRPGARKIAVKVSSWSFSAPGDVKDRNVVVMLGRTRLGRFELDNSLPAIEDELSAYDETGTTLVQVRVPRGFRTGKTNLRLIGKRTGTVIKVPVRVTRR